MAAASGTTTAGGLYSNDPLGYCFGRTLEQRMVYGPGVQTGMDGLPCQAYLAERCARDWDQVCEALFLGADETAPVRRAAAFGVPGAPETSKTAGEQLLATTARQKYRARVLNDDGFQCVRVTEPFDYLRPDSPSITYYSGECVSEYALPRDPTVSERDPVLQHLLDRPEIAPDVLDGMADACRRENCLDAFRHTRLGEFFLRSGRI